MTAIVDQKIKTFTNMKICLEDFTKRIFDIIVSAVGLIILSPVIAVVAIYIKRTSPGPVFYRGPRAGQYGKDFYILKFRTMRDRPQGEKGPRVTAKDDPRVTSGYKA